MKIAIIGAGIAGLYLGLILKSKNYDFDIFEKKKSQIGIRSRKISCEDIYNNLG